MLTVTIALTLVATAKSGILISDPTISQDVAPASIELAVHEHVPREPRRLLFHRHHDDAEPALAGIGCDLASATESVSDSAVERAATMRAATTLCNHINTERSLKRRVIRAVSQTIFERLTPVAAATRRGESLVACGPPLAFSPRRNLWAREGSTEKWLQQVSGYYFAQAFVQDVSFASEPASRFSFYWDPTEPMNSDNPTRNVNPEVIYCAFDQMTTPLWVNLSVPKQV